VGTDCGIVAAEIIQFYIVLDEPTENKVVVRKIIKSLV
jgi:hypothetical protein